MTLEVPRRHLGVLLALAAIGATALVFWHVLALPFVQDDWEKLLRARTEGFEAILATAFDVHLRPFYRPLGELYLAGTYQLFGANPLPFHLAALAIHSVNALLVGLIAHRLTGERLLAPLATLIYASAVAVHLDTLFWAVGIFDLGGAFCFLLALWLFMRDNWGWSALVYGIGCLFKESLIALPLILLGYALLIGHPRRDKNAVAAALGKALPFLVCMAAIAAIKVSGELPLDYPRSHPYSLEAFGPHLWINGRQYFVWLMQAFVPAKMNVTGHTSLVMAAVFALILGFAFYDQRGARGLRQRRKWLFLLLWALIGLVPVIFLPNHIYRYYATYSLAGFVILMLDLLWHLASRLGPVRPAPYRAAILAAIACAAVLGSAHKAARIYTEGLAQRTFRDGTNLLVRRAAYVDIVRDGLARLLPHPPRGAQLVIGDAEVWGFDRNSGPRFWYADNSIEVYELDDLRFAGDARYILGFAKTQADTYTGGSQARIRLNPARAFFFRVVDGALVALGPEALDRLKAMPAHRSEGDT